MRDVMNFKSAVFDSHGDVIEVHVIGISSKNCLSTGKYIRNLGAFLDKINEFVMGLRN